MADAFDYNKLIHLDAEELAELGISKAYQSLFPEFKKYVLQPAQIDEVIDFEAGKYIVKHGPKEYVINSSNLDNKGSSWGRATVALFAIINDQLIDTRYRFYAIHGGNDLCGLFLTSEQAEAAKMSIPVNTNWPYIPKDEPDWYGQYH